MTDACGQTERGNNKRWSDPWPVRFLVGTLALLWSGTVAVAAYQQGAINGLNRDVSAINAKLDSIDKRCQRIEANQDRQR